jgi:hypothetical protein
MIGPQILKRFYICTIESILTGCITTWYGNCSASNTTEALQRVVRTAQYITGAKLPAIQDLYIRWCQRKAQKLSDSSHHSHRLFSLLPYGKLYQSAMSGSKRLLNKSRMFLKAVDTFLQSRHQHLTPLYIAPLYISPYCYLLL